MLAKSIKDLVDISNYKKQCNEIIMQIHPDICHESNSHDAFIKFESLKKLFDEGFIFTDDSGSVTIKENIVKFNGDKAIIAKSVLNYNKIYKLANDNFKAYLPNSFVGDEINTGENFYSLKDVILKEEHARWVLSRLLEFSAYLSQLGYVHVGLNIDSFLINPKTHGLKVISFYHMRPINSKLETVSAKYRIFYPDSVFTNKKAEEKIDTELSKRTVCYLLGDKSGMGVKLRKEISSPLMNFLLRTDSSSIDAYLSYRKLLKDNYENKFYNLEI